MADASSDARIKLWDLPVRLIHWSFVLLLPALWWTWKSGDMALHRQLGYAMLALLVFRVFWGVFGSATARFAGFVRGPRRIADYVARLFPRQAEPVVGHNPLGGLSVVALLGLLSALVGFGLVTQDVDGLESGPLTYLVSYDTAEAARGWHGFLFDVLLWLIGLHVAAMLFYLLVKRDNLVGPMITGRKRSALPAPAQAHPWRILPGAILAIAAVWWVSRGCPLPF